jgi:MFS family permease
MSAMPSGRAMVYLAAALEGAVLAAFCSASQILLGRHYYALSTAQYAGLFAPQILAAITAALIAAIRARRAARGRVLQAGLGLSAAGMVLLIVALVARAGKTVDYPLLLVASALVGAGFGLVYPALTAFAMDVNPMRYERSVLTLNLALAGGLAASPALELAAEQAGSWWVVPVLLSVLAVLMVAVGTRSRFGPDAARSCVLANPRQRAPVPIRIYAVLALVTGICMVMSVTWAQVAMAKSTAHPGFRALLLGTFWAGLVMLARVAFGAIERRRSWRRSVSLVPFLLPAAVALTGLAIQQDDTTLIGIFLLAAVACAAFLPLTGEPGDEKLTLVSLAVAAGIVGIYPEGLGVAMPSFDAFKDGGATPLLIFTTTGAVAVVACLVSAGLLISRGQRPYQDKPAPGQARAHPATGPPEPPPGDRHPTNLDQSDAAGLRLARR